MSELDRMSKATLVVEAALDRKAEGVVALDTRELVSFADTFVFATGTSDRHAKSIADGILAYMNLANEKKLPPRAWNYDRKSTDEFVWEE